MGDEIFTEGLYLFAKKAFDKYGKPIIVTEHGVADMADSNRPDVIKDGFESISKLTEEDVPVLGYFHWSLLDNFEWDRGYWPRFGLVEVDRKTLQRRKRPSFEIYKQLIKENS